MEFGQLDNLAYVEETYKKYQADPNSVESSWRHFFEGMDFAAGLYAKLPAVKPESSDLRIYHLIQAYRTYGHLLAQINPIATAVSKEPPELNLQTLGFSEKEMDASFPTCGFLKEEKAPLKKIVAALKNTYCRTIGVEYMDLGQPELERWLQQKIEPNFDMPLSPEQKLMVMQYLNKAELFEVFLHTKYIGQKRFSLEGAETLIPILAAMLDSGAETGVEDVVLGMAHRGRLNVLANILNKSYAHIFHEFEDYYTPDLTEGTGDVKYHKGFSGELKTSKGKTVHVILSDNPSHLESVDPVVEGEARAMQELKRSSVKGQQVVPILIHGDAAIAGQGVVYETMQLCHLQGYRTGGTVHIVINNQIGFTTLPKESRSTLYCTDVAKAFGAPVFHVNAEDPQGCVAVAVLAMEMRQKFQCDVFIDLNCYRKYGHNEGDEPTFTQPLQYSLIKQKKSIREIYREQLIKENVLDPARAEALEKAFKEGLHKAQESISSLPAAEKEKHESKNPISKPPSVAKESLTSLAERFCTVPESFQIHPKIARLFKERSEMVKGDPKKASIDWGMGEHLALATLLAEGTHVRVSGQDSGRGTFSQRHAMLIDQVSAQKYFPLAHLSDTQAPFEVYNSPLSEYAVLGFEFGYSLSYPQSLVIWEAQYGDFANGAQIIIDQYLSASEQKWAHRCNLTLMLPHGYEGQGPEHSSGRMERFLQLCGEENLRIVNCSTPAQLYHVLRRQVYSEAKKPLVIFTPKAILRHPQCVSSLEDFSNGAFQEVFDDPTHPIAKKLLFCSGKVYYDLVAEREKRGAKDVAIIRIEQLYPLDEGKIKQILSSYSQAGDFVWVQEEHSNMGAGDYIRPLLQSILGQRPLRYAGRGRSASPAAGSHALHKKQQIVLMDEAFK